MVEKVLLVIVPLGLMIAGLVILWVRGHQTMEGRIRHSDRRSRAVAFAGWALFLIGFFTAVGIMSHIFFVLAWIATAIIFLSLFYRYLGMERRSLLWMLMLADQRGIPLEKAARAFAEERYDRIGNRAQDLAEYLEAGLPLALALKRSGLSYPQAVLLATELGQQTGDLGGALQRVLDRNDEAEVVFQSAMERAFYLVFLILFILAMWIFFAISIVPMFFKIFSDFGMELPDVVPWMVSAAGFCSNYWAAVILLAVFLFIALFWIISRVTGSSFRYLPGFNASWNCTDRSILMQWLAQAVRQQRPLPDMMRLICGYLTRRGLRRKLIWAVKRIDQGMDWTESLRKTGLIRKSEAAVFQSAERAGNLAWALEEMAESSVRRSVYRFRGWMNVLFPMAILAMGSVVLMFAMSVWLPLTSIIRVLT
ncbi:MAG: type II secretion system F family protein [Pirellulales bacterium]|nr:type II secretion system F family protein [Pirellulales bacterium]